MAKLVTALMVLGLAGLHLHVDQGDAEPAQQGTGPAGSGSVQLSVTVGSPEPSGGA